MFPSEGIVFHSFPSEGIDMVGSVITPLLSRDTLLMAGVMTNSGTITNQKVFVLMLGAMYVQFPCGGLGPWKAIL